MFFASQCPAQVIVSAVPLDESIRYGTVIQQPIPRTPTKHLGNGPIDMNNLSADILNCDVCRQRLGLPSLSSASGQGVPSKRVILPNGSTLVTPLTIEPSLNNPPDMIPPKSPVPGAPPIRMLGSHEFSYGGVARLAPSGSNRIKKTGRNLRLLALAPAAQ